MFRKNVVLEIGADYVLYENNNSTNYSEEVLPAKVSAESLNIDIKNKKLYFLIEGEELYIRMMTIPRVSGEKIYYIVKSELEYYFRSMKEIVFTYSITRKTNKNLELLVFCINASKLILLEKLIHNRCTLKGVYLIQFCFLNYYKNKIDCKKYVLNFVYKNNLYILLCLKDIIVSNMLIKNYDSIDNYKLILDNFLEKHNTDKYTGDIDTIYFVNFKNKRIVEKISDEFAVKDLGDVEAADILRHFTLKRR